MKENRKTARVDAEGLCSVTEIDSQHQVSALLKDVSISGLGFFSYEKYELNQKVHIDFTLNDSPINALFNVVFALHKEDSLNRYGVEIEHIENTSYALLNEYVTSQIKILWSNKMKKYSGIRLP